MLHSCLPSKAYAPHTFLSSQPVSRSPCTFLKSWWISYSLLNQSASYSNFPFHFCLWFNPRMGETLPYSSFYKTIISFWTPDFLPKNLLATIDRWKPQHLLLPIFLGQILHGVCLQLCSQMKAVAVCAGWWSLKSILGQPPLPLWFYLLLRTLSSHFCLQTQLTSKGGQIPGKERWLN